MNNIADITIKNEYLLDLIEAMWLKKLPENKNNPGVNEVTFEYFIKTSNPKLWIQIYNALDDGRRPISREIPKETS